MKTSIFDFDLPKELIAQKPVSPRDSARLLHVGNDVTDLLVRDLTSLLTPGDVLVINDTKVIPARLRGKRDDVSIEITLHKKNKDETWCAFARPARRLHKGEKIKFSDSFYATVIEKREAGEIIVNFSGQEIFSGLAENGFMPLPPYIARRNGNKEADQQDYQTIYAARPGAVAAPGR